MRFVSRELDRWRALSAVARRYLAHVALLTAGLAAPQLFFNLAVLAQGHGRTALGLLNTVTFGAAAALSLPLWLGVGRIGLRRALVLSAALQCASVLVFAAAASMPALVISAALAGVASVLFQVSAAPFMMRHSDQATRDHLFSAASAVAIGVSGAATLAAGPLPGMLGALLGAPPDSPAAYRAAYLVSAGVLALAAAPLLINVKRKAQSAERSAERRAQSEEQEPADTPVSPHNTSAPLPPTRAGDSTASNDQTFSVPGGAGNACGVQRAACSVPKGVRRSPLPAFRLPLAALRSPLLVPPLLISFGAALLVPYLNLFFAERFGLGGAALGVVFAGFDIATGAALLAGPAISRRLGKMPTVVLTRALALPFTLLIGFAPGLWLAAGAALARVALFNMAAPLYDAAAMERTEEARRPLVIGLIGGAYSAGYLVGPAISALVQERYGFGPLFVATTALYALSVLAAWWFFVRGRGAPQPN